MTGLGTEPINWALVITGILGGIAMLLVGVTQISDALQSMSGTRLQSALSKVSSNRFAGAATGALTTAVIQSSSATTVLTVSFVSAGLLTVTQAAGVVIGANLGTTVTAQIVALDAAVYALAIVALGGILMIAPTQSRRRLAGEATFGLGLVFLGLAAMSEAMVPLRDFEPLTALLAGSDNRLLAALAGAVAAAILQSSSATTGIVVAMSAAGLVNLSTGIAIVIGANIGTCVTAVLAAAGRGVEAMQTAMIHVLVNLVGALIWLVGLDLLVNTVEQLSGTPDGENLATPRELANAHLLFNAANTVLFLAALPLLVRAAQKLVPGPSHGPSGTKRDDPLPALMPSLEERLEHLNGLTSAQLRAALPAALTASESDIDELITADDEVDAEHRAVVDECAYIGQRDLAPDQRRAIETVLAQANAAELIADQVKTGILRAGHRRVAANAHIGPRTRAFLTTLHHQIIAKYDQVMDARTDVAVADEEPNFDAAYRHLSSRLLAGVQPTTYAVAIELLAALEQINAQLDRYVRSRGPTVASPQLDLPGP